jgi:membrane protein
MIAFDSEVMAMWSVLKKTVDEFQKDECPRLAAALAFYTVFSLPALVIATVTIAGLVLDDRELAGKRLLAHIEESTSPAVAEQIGAFLNEPEKQGSGLSWLGGMAVLLFGASGALLEVQTALNRAWGVKPDPKESIWRSFVLKRLLSLGMLLIIAFLLLVSLMASYILSEFRHWIDQSAPQWLSTQVMSGLNVVVSLGIITLLFAAILRIVPDVQLKWSDVWAGAIVTALLFVVGKTGMSIYLAWSNPASAYGAAGSVALLLLWIYYSANILFLGAEFTQVLASRRGRVIQPEAGAVFMECVGNQGRAGTPDDEKQRTPLGPGAAISRSSTPA